MVTGCCLLLLWQFLAVELLHPIRSTLVLHTPECHAITILCPNAENFYGTLYFYDYYIWPVHSSSQLRVHCAVALGTPIVGDFKYGWFVHKRWKQMPRVDIEPLSGTPYKLRRPEGLEVQKGSVLSKVPLLHLHCREMVIPNIAKFIGNTDEWYDEGNPWSAEKPSVLRFVAPMPSHMKISWNLMSSYLVWPAWGIGFSALFLTILYWLPFSRPPSY